LGRAESRQRSRWGAPHQRRDTASFVVGDDVDPPLVARHFRARRRNERVDDRQSLCVRPPMPIRSVLLCWHARDAVSGPYASAQRAPGTLLAAICSSLPEPPVQRALVAIDSDVVHAVESRLAGITSPTRSAMRPKYPQRRPVTPPAIRHTTAVTASGQKTLMFLGSANRDPRRWSAPDRLDLSRNPSGHVGFGMGIHQCVGQHVARLEAEALLTALVQRSSAVELAGTPRRHHNNTLRAWVSLPVALTPA